MTTTVLNTKTNESEIKIPDTSCLMTTTALNKKLEKLKVKFLVLVVWSRKQIMTLK